MPSGQTLQILQADIAELVVDAVVDPSNFAIYTGGAVCPRFRTLLGDAWADIIYKANRADTHLQGNEGNFVEHKLIAKL